MNILISNDDGIYSNGLYELAKALSSIGKVSVVAPDKEQSAIGHAITMHQPLRCKKIKMLDLDADAWWVNGTPADCIKLGIESLLKTRPDLIVSGINNGENLGTDIIYSGTVSAAIEGSIFNIPAIAVSYAKHGETGFSRPAAYALDIIKQVIEKGIPKGTVINVNIPNLEKSENINGVKITKLGVKKYRNNFEERKDPRGNSYYWLAGELVEEDIPEDSDIYAIRKGYISITPINIDLTGFEYIDKLKKWNLTVR
ncbi:MAG: 5'/3'-nucleotidase SurE [Caulobacteraceae bacterium]